MKICTLVQIVHMNNLAGSLINAMTYKCADSPEGYGAFLCLFVCFFLFFIVVVVFFRFYV